ncbi:AraC family transcriptional regulator [Nocardia miyunensis]|uniref:AraC family transcriptional regulator n=1 Tax=Nocardia miyunensis TaxID=282684 RepID=UPI00082D4EB8|nr:AraC family transcriptional regulator [Nocardia miyunensis]
MPELGLADTNGILKQPWIRPVRTSAGLGWEQVYVSAQAESPYRATFEAARTHQLILHLDGPVDVRRGQHTLGAARKVPRGGMFLHPAGRDLSVELGGHLKTIHVYLDDRAVQDAEETDGAELAEELGRTDPLVEQLVLSLDCAVRAWEPTALTYVDQLSAVLGAHLRRHHSTRATTNSAPRSQGLTKRQMATIRELMDARMAEAIPLADLAATVTLSVSQFIRQFKATTGETPHHYLMGLRVEHASRLLRTTSTPIAQVAVSCGFSHQEHLTRVLKARLNKTPAALRREH